MIVAARKAKNAVTSWRAPQATRTPGALPRFGRFLPVVALKTIVKRLRAYAQYFGGPGFIAAGKLEGPGDQFPFDVIDGGAQPNLYRVVAISWFDFAQVPQFQ